MSTIGTRIGGLLLCALWLLPVPAPAQIAPAHPMPMIVGGGATGALGGITVTGNGSAAAQADTAYVTLHLSSSTNKLNRQALQPIIDAMVKAGVDASSITVPIYMNSPANTNLATLSGTIRRPTPEMLRSGIAGVGSAIASQPGLALTNAEIRLTATHCANLFDSAQHAAIAQAEQHARRVAAQIHARLGNVLAVDAYGPFTQPSDECTSYYQIGPYADPSMTSARDYLTVRVMSNVTMRFAIR